MTANEKARDIWFTLFTKQIDVIGHGDGDLCVEMALVVVDEIIKSQKCCYECKYEGSIELKYWSDVKKEIELL
jgi:hypothetical protein